MENNNPSRRHRSDRWARLKKQVRQARTDCYSAYAQAGKDAAETQRRLAHAQKMGKIYKEQAENYYNMMGRLVARVDGFLATVDGLTARVIEQQEEIATLKKTTAK